MIEEERKGVESYTYGLSGERTTPAVISRAAAGEANSY